TRRSRAACSRRAACARSGDSRLRLHTRRSRSRHLGMPRRWSMATSTHSNAFFVGLVLFAAAGTSVVAWEIGRRGAPSVHSSGSADGGGGDASSTSDAPKGGSVQVQLLAINDFHGNLDVPQGSSGIVVAPSSDPIADAGAEAGVKFTDAGTALVPTG